MAVLNTGGSWWFRFAVVPMAIGAGIVAIGMSVGDRNDLNFSSEDAPKPTAAPVGPSPMPRPVDPPAAAPRQAAQPPTAPKLKEAHRPYFYATDSDDQRLPGQQIKVQKNVEIGIHWVIDPSSVSGEIHLRSESADHATVSDLVVETTGFRQVEIGAATRMILTEARPEGERFLADLDISVE